MAKRVLIINTQASRARRNLARILKIASDTEPAFDVVEVLENPKKLDSIVKKHAKYAEELVFGGGDGTVINGIHTALECGFKGVFGIIPVGTANYLARNLQVGLSVTAAFKTLQKRSVHQIYLAKANDHYFALMATIGAATSISQNAELSMKEKFGQLAYILEAIRGWHEHESFEYVVRDTQSGQEYTGVSHQLIFVNADLSQHLKLLPGSSLKSPKLTVVLFKTQNNIFRLLGSLLLYALTLGRHRHWMEVLEAEALTLKTNPGMDVSVDGEVIAKTPIKICIESSPVRMYSGISDGEK